MWHESCPQAELFAALVVIDEGLAKQVQRDRCPACGGALHRRDFPRKPRGALIAEAGEQFSRRFGLCCGREGCRKSVLPPSLRFLGRRVYLEAVVLLACLRALIVGKSAAAVAGVPAKTIRRWLAWWTSDFPTTPTWRWICGRFLPPIDAPTLPWSFLERIGAAIGESPGVDDVLTRAARWLAPLTTRSMGDVPRFVRVD